MRFSRVLSVSSILIATGAAFGVDHRADPATNGILETFTPIDDGAPGKFVPEAKIRSRVSAPWDRPVRQVPADLRTAELPMYYTYQGRAIQMQIDTAVILVKIAGADQPGVVGDAARQQAAVAARAVGLPVARVRDIGVVGYAVIEHGIAGGLAGQAGVNAAIELLLTDPTFEYAAPIYHNPEIRGGITAFLPEINLRANQAITEAGRAIDTIRGAAKAYSANVISEQLAGLAGGAQVRASDRNGFRVLKIANELALDERLAWASPTQLSTFDLHYTPNDQYWGAGSMWGWDQASDIDIDAGAAWDLTRGRSSIVVLALDLGSDQSHPDINQLSGQDFSNGSLNGTGTGTPVTSCDNHGTCVAGIISGRVNNSIGGAGVCPNCRTLSAKVGTTPEPDPGDPCGGAWASTSNPATALDVRIANAINWGLGQNISITNGSYGTGESDLITDAYSDAAASGVLNFASAGNSGTNAIGYPARLTTCLAVAAIDSDGTLSSFSQYGTGLDFCAPGTNVRAADRQGTAGYSSTDYTTFSGTSAASPFAAGCAALIWSAYPHYSDAGIANLMRFYATDLGAGGYDTTFGWGFPNVNDAIRAVFPQNNWCDMATSINTWAYNPSAYSTGNASEVPEELDEGCEAGGAGVNKSVWYTFIPPCNGTFSINTNGSDYDTVLSVWRGSCTSAIQVGCDDDSGTGTASQITNLAVSAGLTYYIKVSSYGANGGGGQLDFNFLYEPTAPFNDHCANAFDIPFNQLTLNSCTVGADETPCEGSDSCEAGNAGVGHTVWYEFTTPSIGRFNLDTEGSAIDTVLSVWRGACGTYLDFNGQILCATFPVAVGCDDDGGTGTTSRITALAADAVTTYRFKIGSWGSTPGGDMTFHFQFVPCPADFNLSGSVSVQDIFDFLAAYFANDPRGNFNHFGGITVQDIFDFLAAYFSGQC